MNNMVFMTESAIFLLTKSIFSAWYNIEYITSLFCGVNCELNSIKDHVNRWALVLMSY